MSGDDAHGIGHHISLRIMEARGHVLLGKNNLETARHPAGGCAAAQPPAETTSGWMEWTLMRPKHAPQVRGQHRQIVHPFAGIYSLRRKRDLPAAVTDVQAAGTGSIADTWPVGLGNQRQGMRRCKVQ